MNRKIIFLFCIALFACNLLNAETSKNEAFNIVQETVLNKDYQLTDDDNTSSRVIFGEQYPTLCDTFTYTVFTASGCNVTWTCSDNLIIIAGWYSNTATVIAIGTGIGWVRADVTCGMMAYYETLSVLVSIPFGSYPVYSNYTVTTSPTISSPIIIDGTFTINAPNTVTVRSDVYATPNAQIIVQPGATLVVEGVGTLTSYCQRMWKGVIVYGNIFYQGIVLVGDEGTVENAVTGIDAITGGKIEAAHANFINNYIAIQIDMYSEGTFIATRFDVNSGFSGPTGIRRSPQVILNGTRERVRFLECRFSDTYYHNFAAIRAFDADFSAEHSSYYGFRYGIDSYNSGGSFDVLIAHCHFSTNQFGIRVDGTDRLRIHSNDIKLLIDNARGLDILNSTDYEIFDNEFIRDNGALSTKGIVVENSGFAENRLYQNIFYDVEIGIQALGINSDSPFGGSSGLQFLCNYFRDTQQTDILVGDGYSPFGHSVRRVQGSSANPAGNKFITPCSGRDNIDNRSGYFIDYYYNTFEEYPCFYSGPVAPPIYSPNPANCPSKGKSGLSLHQYDEYNSQYEYWLAQLLDTEYGSEEYHLSLNMVSGYSAQKDHLFNSIIIAAMEENSELGIRNYENLRFLFAYRGHYTDYLSIMESYLAEGNHKGALATLTSMYQLFKLTEENIMELQGLETYIKWLQQLANEEKTIYMLSSKEVDELVKYVEANIGRGVVFANNILCVLYDVCLEKKAPIYAAPKNQTNEKSSMQMDNKELLDKISVAPNPTNGELRITNYELRIDKIEVLDIIGRVVSSNHLITSSSNPAINISNLNPGIYFIKIATEVGVVVKKVVKQ